MNNIMDHTKGIFGVAATGAGAVVAWLPTINFIVQIGAGLTAIVVGIVTIRYYHQKERDRK